MLFPQVPCDRSSEIEELRSIIENLRDNQQRLQREKAEEVEQLHEVIERLQRELSRGGPAVHGAEVSRLLGDPAVVPEARAAAGAVGRRLPLEALPQHLWAAEEAAARQWAELECSAALREAEVQGLASQIHTFRAALQAKEAKVAERDLASDAMKQQKLAHSAELETIVMAFSRFCLAMAAEHEPPELQGLRAQCVRLSGQLQVRNQRFPSCQKGLGKRQAWGARLHPRVEGSSRDGAPGLRRPRVTKSRSKMWPAGSHDHVGGPLLLVCRR